MTQTFRNYEVFKRTSPENVSKVDFERFKTAAISQKKHFDSNVSELIGVERKIIAGKNRQQTNRALALSSNMAQTIVIHDTKKDAINLYNVQKENSNSRFVPD